MKETEYKISGYSFSDVKEFKEAKREAETIDYIKANTDLNDLNKAVKLYHKLVERQTLKTILGCNFLKELQDRILREGIISPDTLPNIRIEKDSKQYKAFAYAMEHDREQKIQNFAENYRIKHRNSRIINVFLFVIIAAMLLISFLSKRNVSTNYENDILNKYSAWEEDLKAKEAALEEREAALLKE